ncbi:PRC-barrel domain protein OS=Pedosphaera parvula (strain Ellin514) GN=Cflav_PD5202 PE=4 SV=1: PRC [Gemmataceae bacterium]|nr:PRC-barrel domain protein OS=Pedosphaera parvula (strain Ellin514) GN=Cflav_PD5202 PE=4 SV=1: PRC [Gemmataceae bacterium]VTT99289.1 PRC-barrel domain protein OS=Pedosphaera parvula (strain Ellin514) GN=Cflav_PD5202 PE=4 SV=1: PRC [Gemmataceae bacterium]
MMSKVIRTSAAAAFLLTAGFITAQEPGAVPATVPAAPQAAPQAGVRVQAQPAQAAGAVATYRAKQILGTKITLQGNAAAGTVDDIVFDSAGNLEYLIVSNDGKLVTVPWDAAKFDVKSQTATLTITPEVYRTIPTYTPTTYPDYWTPDYRTATYKFYNLTPRELRRLDRRIP